MNIVQFCWLLLLPMPWLWIAASAISTEKPNCPKKCGNITIPYPFGIGNPRCSMNKSFLLKCNHSKPSNSSSKLLLGDLQVLNISAEEGTVTVSTYVPYYCYDMDWIGLDYWLYKVDLTGTPFTFSATENRFIAIGCDTVGYIEDSNGTRFGSGCISFCYHPVNLTREDPCSGVGCCQTQIPSGVKTLDMSIDSVYNYSYSSKFSPCNYIFLARKDWFDFSTIDLIRLTNVDRKPPTVLDWAVGEETCESMDLSYASSSIYPCGPNTNCVNSNNGPGYRCVCKPGYQGNPYLFDSQGCKDIDECLDQTMHRCEGTCKNTQGNYTCHCPLGMSGDGKVACQGFRVTTLIAVCGILIFLAFMIIVAWIECKRRKKHRNFQQNGGSFLKNQKIRIFSEKELVKATEKYDNNRLLGQGGSGAVYKGVLANGSLVAIKKPNVADKTKIKHFQREVIKKAFQHEISIVSQVNHKNVVKLLGLCLETEFPSLIYEFISNGSLFDHLHVKRSAMLKSWANRLRIAAEISLALDYLHSLADPPIIHRDVKSMNILLDEKFTAKVSDFGASVLIPFGQSVVDTKIHGTHGYLDPEYLITGLLTVKSDLYSFGVVLIELLTGQKPILKRKNPEENVNFIQYFISSVEQKKISQVLMNCEDVDRRESEQIEVVAELAVRCLNSSSIERPTMKEVAEQLNGLMKLHETFEAQENDEEVESLLGKENDAMFYSISETHYMTAFDIELQ
ncbi:Wall-associated receptor kinase 2 [Camellia lanceoleosa]|uniref:Wall-associated receptor kinase 2 n=1 Tax=Camellia lanceoleosa TaxID=1840588 RepID=A0ACC0GFX6_9ERIC|nr:Wall-associated receptor kinase 2 [Camellia lanceoleosa]